MSIHVQARRYQRRIDAALRSTVFPPHRLARLSRRLYAHRHHGSPSLLAAWLGEYRATIETELRSALRYRRA